MGNIFNKNEEKEFFSDTLFYQLIFNNDYLIKINKEGHQKEKKDIKEEKQIKMIFYQEKLNLPINKINENINLEKTFNLFYKALGNRIGIILLFNEDRKKCLFQIKELFKMLYYDLIEEYQQYIKKFCYIYLLDSMEEKELFQLFIRYSKKNVNKIKYPLILFIQKDSDDFEFNQSCIKYIFEDLNDKEYFIDILLSLLKDKIETEKNINEMNNNENINQYYFEDEREKNKYNFITPNENLMNKEFKDNDYDNIDEKNEERYNMELNNNNKYKIENSYDLLNNKINAYNNEDDNYKNEEHYFKEEEIEEAKKNLNEEPDENNLDGTEIIIRHPKTGKRSSRRFYKTDTIQSLYNYIVSNEEILKEINYQNFNISQPFPKKIFNDFEETFEDAYLYPDGIIDIEIAK